MHQQAYSLSACSACVSDTTLRLRPRLGVPMAAELVCVAVGLKSSRQKRKIRFRSRGIPSNTTVEMGTKGRSSMPAARMAYS